MTSPSKTFTIDVPMPAEDGADEASNIVQLHEVMIQNLVDAEDLPGDRKNPLMTDVPSSTSGSGAFSTSTPSVGSRSVQDFSSIQPQFNLDSAAILLESFKVCMLPYFPVIILSPDATVPSLAKERPFILLAILAAASGGRSLQGHNLYDEEFRKVLGLKFVSGGERSLELLIGLLIYCAWYPFHLRPKNKQALQYLRMASDIVRDLDLDQPLDGIVFAEARSNPKRMNSIRAYLATQYLCSGFAAAWKKTDTLPFQNWTATCCDILSGNDNALAATSDQTLAYLCRLQHFVAEAAQINKRGGGEQHEEQHILLMVKGMEAQLQEIQCQLSSEISSQSILHMANLITNIVLCGFPLLKFPYVRTQKRDQSSAAYADPDRLFRCATMLRTWYDYILSVPTAEFSYLPGTVWAQLVASIILGLRLSFPLPNGGTDWDHAAARRVLNFGDFLTQFSRGVDGVDGADLAPTSSRRSTGTDVLSASKLVVDMVRRKYEKRLAALEMAEATRGPHHPGLAGLDKSVNKCPMLDGSLDQYIQDWDERFFGPTSYFSPVQGISGLEAGTGTSASGSESQPAHFHDLWATMTMGWSQDLDGIGNMDFNGV
ncbi:hypothetical protein N0V82_004653 [Gnomoniopsis sp. IMI 355080]|nr:hypothetical protein N0V82_004653 [Gnomoniopsis sp. IMI 355080]